MSIMTHLKKWSSTSSWMTDKPLKKEAKKFNLVKTFGCLGSSLLYLSISLMTHHDLVRGRPDVNNCHQSFTLIKTRKKICDEKITFLSIQFTLIEIRRRDLKSWKYSQIKKNYLSVLALASLNIVTIHLPQVDWCLAVTFSIKIYNILKIKEVTITLA